MGISMGRGVVELTGCNGCQLFMSEGWRFDARKCMDTIQLYVQEWPGGVPPDEAAIQRVAEARACQLYQERLEAARVEATRPMSSYWIRTEPPVPPVPPVPQLPAPGPDPLFEDEEDVNGPPF